MENFILYINILSFYFIFSGIIKFIYPWVMDKIIFKNINRKFLLTRVFGTTTINTWRLLYASLLWLIVYYFNEIKILLGIL